MWMAGSTFGDCELVGVIGRVGIYYAFPLTPALSLGEREDSIQRKCQLKVFYSQNVLQNF
jgi:hypothetical protein